MNNQQKNHQNNFYKLIIQLPKRSITGHCLIPSHSFLYKKFSVFRQRDLNLIEHFSNQKTNQNSWSKKKKKEQKRIELRAELRRKIAKSFRNFGNNSRKLEKTAQGKRNFVWYKQKFEVSNLKNWKMFQKLIIEGAKNDYSVLYSTEWPMDPAYWAKFVISSIRDNKN